MPEYIEREKVLSKAAPVKGCFSDMISVYDVIMLPAVDVAPVRHGRWRVDGVYVVCSVCNRLTLSPIVKQIPTFKYCPNCGAKMDEKVSE